MLILWGRHDFVFDVDYYNEWCRRFPDAEHHLFDDAGHYLMEDVPDRIIGLVRDFSGSVSGKRRIGGLRKQGNFVWN